MAVFSFISNYISNLLESAKKSVKTNFILIFRDERGVLEPQADLLSLALAVIGFVVLAALMSQVYLGIRRSLLCPGKLRECFPSCRNPGRSSCPESRKF